MLLIEKWPYLDFQVHVISYSSSIFKGAEKGNYELDFRIYEIDSLEMFSHVNLTKTTLKYTLTQISVKCFTPDTNYGECHNRMN